MEGWAERLESTIGRNGIGFVVVRPERAPGGLDALFLSRDEKTRERDIRGEGPVSDRRKIGEKSVAVVLKRPLRGRPKFSG